MNTKIISSGERISGLRKLHSFLKTPSFAGCRYFILTDEQVYLHCLPELVAEVEALQEAELLEIESGEKSKSLDLAQELWMALLESGADKNTVLINLGGGVISDIGGFVASAYKRGIRYINIPTTLLGMVDAAIGGKTAVNIGVVKNQIGFFHLPVACCIEPSFLNTLPASELLSGMGETLKTVLLKDRNSWETLEKGVWGENKVLDKELITSCALFKHQITKKDPLEKSVRKILNFGHTFGHAIESWHLEENKALSHGHAVAWGMIYELLLSVQKCHFPEMEAQQIINRIQLLFPVHSFSEDQAYAIYSYMKHDKKNSNQQVQCVLLKAIGEPVIDNLITKEDIFEVMQVSLPYSLKNR